MAAHDPAQRKHCDCRCVKQGGCCARYEGNQTVWARNLTKCPDKKWADCEAYCTGAYRPQGTAPFMGGIHPRDKRPVGVRLAAAAAPLAYGLRNASAAFTGPTLSGCKHTGDSIVLSFNKTLLGADSVAVGKYGPPAEVGKAATISSSMHVLIDPSYWCAKTILNRSDCNSKTKACPFEWYCADPGAPSGGACGGSVVCGADALAPKENEPMFAGHPKPPTANVWIEVDIAAGAEPGTVSVDLGKLNGSKPVAIRYAWSNNQPSCCLCEPSSAVQKPLTDRTADPLLWQALCGRRPLPRL